MSAAGKVKAMTIFYSGVPVPQRCSVKNGTVTLLFQDGFAAGLFINKMSGMLQPSSLKLKLPNSVRITPMISDPAEQTVDKIVEALQTFFKDRMPMTTEVKET